MFRRLAFMLLVSAASLAAPQAFLGYERGTIGKLGSTVETYRCVRSADTDRGLA